MTTGMTVGCVLAGVSGLACTMVDVSGEAFFSAVRRAVGRMPGLGLSGSRMESRYHDPFRRGCSGPLPLWSFFVFAASVCFSFVGQAYGARGDTHPGLKILGLHFCFSTLHFRTFSGISNRWGSDLYYYYFRAFRMGKTHAMCGCRGKCRYLENPC